MKDADILEFEKGLFMAMYKYIRQNAQNRRLLSYNSDVCARVIRLVGAIEADEINVGDFFNKTAKIAPPLRPK